MMKSYLALFLLGAVLASCSEKDLDILPSDQLSDATVWTDSSSANLFLNDIYNSLNAGPYGSSWLNLPTQIGNDGLDDYTDDATYGAASGTPSYQLFDNSSYGPSNLLFTNTWKIMYANIRKCNLMIQKVSASDFSDATKRVMVAQARFLRVYFYKTLIDLYGGVPLITKVLDNNTGADSLFYPRSTYPECVAFIQSECTAAAADLPQQWTGKDVGRATWGAAMALKGEEELYAGKWQDAAATNKAIMDAGVYALFSDYAGLFYADHENNEEVIFDIQFAPNVRPKHINQYWGVVEVSKGGGWGNCDPTQDLVDCYEYLDGKTAGEGSAQYDPDHPYAHRDKRFYASVIYDGSIWRGKTIYTRLGVPNNPNEINITGKSGNTGRTGYFMKKLQDSTIASTPSDLDGTNVIVFRYAEVLLNYAEAQNEAAGPDASVYSALNEIRGRAGLPSLPEGLDQNAMRERIRRERRVELAFEGKRFYDIRRWKTAADIFSRPIHGMKITEVSGKLRYEKIEVRKVTFDAPKNYLMPVPQYAIDQNPKLTQNPSY
ncbi:RagB/SusD family nutrient uptake outer membrane protein [Compostibacter hankyongensis]